MQSHNSPTTAIAHATDSSASRVRSPFSPADIIRAMHEPRSVAITGACERIGSALAEQLAAQGYPLTLLDRPDSAIGTMSALGAIVELDLAQPPPPELFKGVEVVVHLAGEARRDASWETLLPDTIQVSYNVASAAIRAGCRRLIVASSVHAVYASPTLAVAPDGPVAPADLYGVTKCFVEALAFWCAHQGPMSAAAVRIGAFQTLRAARAPGAAERMADTFIAVPDLLSLLELAINAEYQFAVLTPLLPAPMYCSTRARPSSCWAGTPNIASQLDPTAESVGRAGSAAHERECRRKVTP